jgi:hypothetical protein
VILKEVKRTGTFTKARPEFLLMGALLSGKINVLPPTSGQEEC